jgi:hypothetical protein
VALESVVTIFQGQMGQVGTGNFVVAGCFVTSLMASVVEAAS